MTEHNNAFQEAYSDESFWDKLFRYAKTAGKELVEKALWLYYAAQRPTTPVWAKGVIYGALGYFILPVDAITDIIPGIGYSDDLGIIAAAIGVVAMYMDDEVKAQATQKLRDWFGD